MLQFLKANHSVMTSDELPYSKGYFQDVMLWAYRNSLVKSVV